MVNEKHNEKTAQMPTPIPDSATYKLTGETGSYRYVRV